MESFVPSKVRTLGISNIYQPQALRDLYDLAMVKPSIVQNRFYPATGYDHDIRAFCAKENIVYQSFWTLTANPGLLKSNAVRQLSENAGVSPAVALYGLVNGLGNVSVLDGTTNATRMQADLEGTDRIANWARREAETWEEMRKEFQSLLENQR
jgi:diketogulonate reductase-like aldo/keto reductase